jgi:malate/lactate dehydrogenase
VPATATYLLQNAIVEDSDEVLPAFATTGGDVMAAMYGVLAAVPVIWGCAGYVLVSHPGTAETATSRKANSTVGPRN